VIAALWLAALLGCCVPGPSRQIELVFPDGFRGRFEIVESDSPDPGAPTNWIGTLTYRFDQHNVLLVPSLQPFSSPHRLTARTRNGRPLSVQSDRQGQPAVWLAGRVAGIAILFGSVGSKAEFDRLYDLWLFDRRGIRPQHR
jgi:hypothetical protein